MITDHSSAGFEYLLPDRPLVRIHVPALIGWRNIHPDYVACSHGVRIRWTPSTTTVAGGRTRARRARKSAALNARRSRRSVLRPRRRNRTLVEAIYDGSNSTRGGECGDRAGRRHQACAVPHVRNDDRPAPWCRRAGAADRSRDRPHLLAAAGTGRRPHPDESGGARASVAGLVGGCRRHRLFYPPGSDRHQAGTRRSRTAVMCCSPASGSFSAVGSLCQLPTHGMPPYSGVAAGA